MPTVLLPTRVIDPSKRDDADITDNADDGDTQITLEPTQSPTRRPTPQPTAEPSSRPVTSAKTETTTNSVVPSTPNNVVRVELLNHSGFEMNEDWGPYKPWNWMIRLAQNERVSHTGQGSVLMKNMGNLTNAPALTLNMDNAQDFVLLRIDFYYLPTNTTLDNFNDEDEIDGISNGDGIQVDYRIVGNNMYQPIKKWIYDDSRVEDEQVTPQAYNRRIHRFSMLDGEFKMATALMKIDSDMGNRITMRWKMISPMKNDFTLYLDDVAVYGVPRPSDEDVVDLDSDSYEVMMFPTPQVQFPFDNITPRADVP